MSETKQYRIVGGPSHGLMICLPADQRDLSVAEPPRYAFAGADFTPEATPDPIRVHRYEVRRVFLSGFSLGAFLVHESLWNCGDERDWMGVYR